jgi:hypothetical protein
VLFANWHNTYQTPDSGLALVDKWAQRFYDLYWFTYTGLQENCEFRISNCGLKISPNPVCGRGAISFSLPAAAHVSMKLYNIAGRLVETLYDGFKPAGVHEFYFHAGQLPQGTYFLVLETPSLKKSESFVVVR